MRHARLIGAAVLGGFVVLAAPVTAHAQFGGLVNRAKQAVRPDKPQERPAANRDNVATITNDNIAAYIRGNRAEKAEMKRLDSLQSLAANTPEAARQVALLKCQSRAMEGMSGTPDQRHADSVRAMKSLSSMDTVKMKKLAQAAQAGDAAAMAELRQMTMQYAQREATDPAAIAQRERFQKQMGESIKRSAACEKSVPPVSAFAGPIATAKAEMAKYGSSYSPAYTSHLSSVKLSAAGGMSPAEYAVIEERIRGYISSSREPERGFSQAELAALRAHRSELSALTF